jgi:hypothetical protein
MSRFFFDTHDGERFEDREGVEFPDAAAAQQAAVEALVSIAKDRFTTPSDGSLEMTVRDSAGKAIMTCCLSLAVRRPD